MPPQDPLREPISRFWFWIQTLPPAARSRRRLHLVKSPNKSRFRPNVIIFLPLCLEHKFQELGSFVRFRGDRRPVASWNSPALDLVNGTRCTPAVCDRPPASKQPPPLAKGRAGGQARGSSRRAVCDRLPARTCSSATRDDSSFVTSLPGASGSSATSDHEVRSCR